MKTEKVVVFDVDGTLFDTKQGIIKALNEVLDSFEINEIKKEDEDNWIGPPVRDSFIKYAKKTALCAVLLLYSDDGAFDGIRTAGSLAGKDAVRA